MTGEIGTIQRVEADGKVVVRWNGQGGHHRGLYRGDGLTLIARWVESERD